MGAMTFLLPGGLSPDIRGELQRACVAGGPDNMPWPTQVRVEADRIVVQRAVDESGYLLVPWETDGAGRLMATTATLMERPEPYHIALELARGKINQVRCQAEDWRAGGLAMPVNLDDLIRTSSSSFGRALVDPASDEAQHDLRQALAVTYRAADELARVYSQQVFQVRHQREPRLGTTLSCRVTSVPDEPSSTALAAACNTVSLPFFWNVIEPSAGTYNWEKTDALLEWAERQHLSVNAGPLIDFSPALMPDWLWLWERDLTSIHKFMGAYVANAVKRYRRRIRRWQLTNASNSASLLSLGEEEMLWLTVKMAQVARQVDPDLELVVGITQPWGEYMAGEDRSHSPFIFADTLIRSDLNLSALDVEVVMGMAPRGSYCRDLLDTSRMLDLYAMLGVPLRITLGYPSSADPDSAADPELRVDAGRWRADLSPAAQAEWTGAFTALALCKPYVHAVQWVHCCDGDPHQFPNCGLIHAGGQRKPALESLRRLREEHLYASLK
jgi:Glycosyl hydrolase family 10